ncbi:MAG: hypothetical protein LQ351_008089 [Letrouitia transgressa]|nr:MAG: hypothetical protein LQ351_008089 [Letrouitia transgressa]
MDPPARPVHLCPSELGTKEFWDKTYTTDLDTHSAHPSHSGQAWFADSSASTRALAYLSSLSLSPKTSFLDLGTGNGEMLFLLRSSGRFCGKMLGIDYSARSVEFASRLAAQKGLLVTGEVESKGTGSGEESTGVEFRVWDIMGSDLWMWGQWDVVLDKGTFDAVSLNPDTDVIGRRVVEGYRERVERMVKPGGRFLVTSCNWIEEELKAWFEGESLVWEGRVGYPRFSFGGKQGQSVSGVCFIKEMR